MLYSNFNLILIILRYNNFELHLNIYIKKVCTVKKDKLIKLTKYLSNKKEKIKENEENVKIYFVKHLI